MAYGQNQAIRERPPDELAPVIEFDDFMTYVIGSSDPALRWAQNQHMALVGPTDSGKSTALHAMLPLRRYTTFLGTKIKDDTLQSFITSGEYTRLYDWPPVKGLGPFKRQVSAEDMPKRLLWPDVTSLEAVPGLAPVFNRAVSDIYGQGGWCTVWDEFWLQCEILKMRQTSKILLQQARSNDISMVMGMQRPAWIPPEVFDQTRHLLFWRDNDELNLKRIGSVGWLSAGPIRAFVAGLDPFQFLYVNNRTGYMYRSTAPELVLAA
jgi:energy-coupling factor transporter ATP-binding protein EcfA2